MEILFLPGYACTSRIWLPVSARLGSGFANKLVDWPRRRTPGFHAVEDFARWLCEAVELSRYDYIVGHSMGGLVGVELLASGASSAHLVLVESFLVSPAPFFHNLVLGESTLEAVLIRRMLADEQPHYSAALPGNLRDLDLSASVLGLAGRVTAFYGDRGCGQPERVTAELRWPPALSARLPVHTIPGACHFPMVENPAATSQALSQLCGERAAP